MNWYKGGIAEAITASRRQNSVFVVYIQGTDEKSNQFTELVETGDVASVLGGENFTAIKVEANSVAYQQFCEIYKQVAIPSLYFIGKAGVTVDILKEAPSKLFLLEKINNVLLTAGKPNIENFLESERNRSEEAAGVSYNTNESFNINETFKSANETLRSNATVKSDDSFKTADNFKSGEPCSGPSTEEHKPPSLSNSGESCQSETSSPSSGTFKSGTDEFSSKTDDTYKSSETFNSGLTFNSEESESTSKFGESSVTSKSGATATTVSTSEVLNPPNTDSSSSIDLAAIDDKVAHAQELIEKKREAKKVEAEETEKSKEIERRKMGQDVQKLKRWQQEQELKNIMEAREKEKKEEKAARQRVLDQIKQDKAERANKFAANQPIQPTPASDIQQPSRPRPVSSRARLQFKMPDGSSRTSEFESSSSLMEVRNYISEIMNMSVSHFTLSTTFPRREFTNGDNNLSLIELELVPNAVILVLPLSHGAVSTNNSSFIYSLLWSVLTPILSLYNYLKSYFVGGVPPPRSEVINDVSGPSSNKKRPSESTGENSRAIKRKPGETTAIRRQGNVHRLTDKTDSDDENNTWNGNSTQQM